MVKNELVKTLKKNRKIVKAFGHNYVSLGQLVGFDFSIGKKQFTKTEVEERIQQLGLESTVKDLISEKLYVSGIINQDGTLHNQEHNFYQFEKVGNFDTEQIEYKLHLVKSRDALKYNT
jgi:hypothetical protein